MMNEDIIALHEQRMTERQQLQQQIPELTAALAKDPKNVAIKERLALAEDISSDVNYLLTGPHLIAQYMSAKDPVEKEHYKTRYYEDALKISAPPCLAPSSLAQGSSSSSNNNNKRKRGGGGGGGPSKKKHQQIISNPSNSPHSREMAGNCLECGAKESTVYLRREGHRACRECGIAVVDNLASDWNDLGYDERMSMNVENGIFFDRNTDSDDEDASGNGSGISGASIENTANGEMMSSQPNKYKYECRSYMLDRLLAVQCLEHAKIDPADIEKIYATLHRHRIYDVTGWKASDMREFLKTCKLPKLYKHVNYLLNYMSARVPIRIDPEVQNLFIEAFDKVEMHMHKYKGLLSDYRTPQRKSRPHYGYICRQIAKILGQDDLIAHFPQLISPEKILLYDAFWAKVCECCGWTFHPSPR